jgi:hypothetical protein
VEIFAISDTGGKLSGVSTTPLENLPPISTTPSANFAYATTGVIDTVHPHNVRFQNVRFQNVWFQNVWNVRFTKRLFYKTSGLQNVRFTKCQVFKTSSCKKTSIYILYLWLVEIHRFWCSHVCRQSYGCVLFSILEVFLPYITIIASGKSWDQYYSADNLKWTWRTKFISLLTLLPKQTK